MAVILGITVNVIVDGEPLEEFNEGDDVDERVDSDCDSDYAASSSDADDQKYIDDQKALLDLVNPRRRRYFGPNRHVTKYISSVSGANFEVRVCLSQSRIQKLKSEALVFKLCVDGNHLRSTIWKKKDGTDSINFRSVIAATPAGPFKKPFHFSEIITSKPDIDFSKHGLTISCLIGNDHPDTTDVPEKNLDRIGTILLNIFRATNGKRTREMNYKGKKIEGLEAVSEISEQSLKGKTLTHCAK